jgi:hypothetical protein
MFPPVLDKRLTWREGSRTAERQRAADAMAMAIQPGSATPTVNDDGLCSGRFRPRGDGVGSRGDVGITPPWRGLFHDAGEVTARAAGEEAGNPSLRRWTTGPGDLELTRHVA